MLLDLDFTIDFGYLDKIFENYQIKNDGFVARTTSSEQRVYICEQSQNQDRYLIGFVAYAFTDDQTPLTYINGVAFRLSDSDGIIFPNMKKIFPPILTDWMVIQAESRMVAGGFTDTKKLNIKANINKVIKAGKTTFVDFYHFSNQSTFYFYTLYVEGKLREVR